MQGVIETFMVAMRKQLQGTDQVPIRETAFAGMREMEGSGLELGIGMAVMDVETKNETILGAGSEVTINDEVLTRQEKVQTQDDAAADARIVGIDTGVRTSLSRASMFSDTALNWIN